jgi:hypothetical protein
MAVPDHVFETNSARQLRHTQTANAGSEQAAVVTPTSQFGRVIDLASKPRQLARLKGRILIVSILTCTHIAHR